MILKQNIRNVYLLRSRHIEFIVFSVCQFCHHVTVLLHISSFLLVWWKLVLIYVSVLNSLLFFPIKKHITSSTFTIIQDFILSFLDLLLGFDCLVTLLLFLFSLLSLSLLHMCTSLVLLKMFICNILKTYINAALLLFIYLFLILGESAFLGLLKTFSPTTFFHHYFKVYDWLLFTE